MKKSDFIKLIKKDVNKWNNWHKKNSKINYDLSYTHFDRLDLTNIDLRNGILKGIKFDSAVLRKSRFGKSDLENALFKNAILTDANFIKCNLRNANFNYSSSKRVILENTNAEKASFQEASLKRARLNDSNLKKTDFLNTDLRGANLDRVNLEGSSLYLSNLRDASFKNANLKNTSLMMTNLTNVDFSGADLTGSNLQGAQLISTNFENAKLNQCKIYGTSVWSVNLNNTEQKDLIITRQSKISFDKQEEGIITLDNLLMAQFIYLLLENKNIRSILETVTSKVVLILGNFSEGKKILELLRKELRKYDFIPVLFDFKNAKTRDLSETITTLAHISKFVIVDLTDPISVPHELEATVPHLPSVVFKPIIKKGKNEYAMLEHLKQYPWFLDVFEYEDENHIIMNLNKKIIVPSMKKSFQLIKKR